MTKFFWGGDQSPLFDKKQKKEFIIMGIVFVLVFLAHFLLPNKIYDMGNDDYRYSTIKLDELFNYHFRDGSKPYIMTAYSYHTSRVLIEIVIVFLLKFPLFVFYFLNTVIVFWIVYMFSYLFTENTLKTKLIVLATYMCTFPIWIMGECGWYATLGNYLWPFAFGMYAMVPIKNILIAKKEKWWQYPLYVFSLIFGCNQEQMCALVLAFYLIFFVYLLIKQKKFSPFMLIQIILAFASLIFILTCPGNSIRYRNFIINYPEFENFSFIQKIMLGMNSTIARFLVYPSFLLSICFLVFIPVMLSKDKLWVRLISFLPLLFMILIMVCPQYDSLVFHNTYEIEISVFTDILNTFNIFKGAPVSFSGYSIVVFLISISVVFIICFCLYRIGKKQPNMKFLLPLIFLAGLASRVIIGFTPTCADGSHRTFFFFLFSMIIIMVIGICNNYIQPYNYTKKTDEKVLNKEQEIESF